MSHHHHQWSCLMASDHQVGFRALSSTAPSKRYRSGHQLDQHGLKCTLSFLIEEVDFF